jgi:phosphatidylcholine synthase
MIGSRSELGLVPAGDDAEEDEGRDARRDLILRVAAWGVHLYTAIDLVIAARMAVLLVRGGAEAIREAFVLMLVASLVDATDGTLARKVRVKAVLPEFDGRKLDDIIDFLTYTFLPLLLVWRAGLFPEGAEPWLLLPLLASAYGFCQVEAKTDDGYFLGFPSLWNVVAFYLYVLHLPGWLAVAIVSLLALMTFVPSRYLYPSSHPGALNVASNLLGAPWCCLLLVVMIRLPAGDSMIADDPTWWLAAGSLYFPIFYMVASWTVTVKLRKARRA